MAVHKVLSVALFCFCHFSGAHQIVNVSTDCSQISENSNGTVSSGSGELYCLDSALNNLRNGTSLLLAPGTHIVRQAQSLDSVGLSDISITGAGVNETVVTCEDGYGLVFIGVKNLSLVGFTILNCGLANEQLDHAFSLLHLSINFFFLTIPSNSRTKIAMFVGNCANVMMEDIHITNTTGLGLLGVNIVGSSMLNRVNFTRNVRPLCLNDAEPDFGNLYFNQIGGGAYFVFFDYRGDAIFTDFASLLVRDSYFAHNADCTLSAYTSVNVGFDLSRYYSYTLGAGGGLSIIAASRDIEVRVVISNSIFYQNDARYGGGAFVASFAEVQRSTSVRFENCAFLENGVGTADGILQTFCQGGAGLAIFTGLTKPLNIQTSFQEGNASIEESVQVVVSGSTFTRNQAEIQGGGVMAYSLFHTFLSKPSFFVQWLLQNLTFVENSARFSSALHATEEASTGLAVIVLQNTTVQDNFNQLYTDAQNVDVDDAAVFVKDITCIINGTAIFRNNLGSAFRIVNSNVAVKPFSSLVFEQNLAHRGGAIYFSGESALIKLHIGSTLTFIGNQGVAEGGAMYVSPLPVRREILKPGTGVAIDCYIAPLSDYFNLSFADNFAPLGDIFFGPSQEKCIWAADYLSKQENLFNTLPTYITANLSNTLSEKSVFPGQMIDIEITVFDAYSQTIPALVSSVVTGSDNAAFSMLGNSRFWHTSVSDTQLSVIAANHTGPLTISIVAEQNSVSTTFTLNLTSCPIGFWSDELSPRCTCYEALVNASGILCFENSVSFVTQRRTWIGVDPDINQSTSSDLVIHVCPLNYCKALGTNNTVMPPEFDSQCDLNRAGFLCGGCALEYSIVFGTNECHKCNNYWLFLVPSFAIAGAVLFSGIALLEFTIDKGLTNVIISFGSLVSLFSFLRPSDINFSYYFLFFRLFALQLGASTCLYDGMTTLERSALLFTFPLYLLVLMVIFTLLCRRFTWMSVHFSPAKTLETLSLMCYLSVLSTSVDILLPIKVETISGEVSSYRWFLDPSVKYYSGAHAALVTFALLTVIFYIIPVPLLFLFPSFAYRHLKKFTPFWDSLWAAYKPKFRFWLGVRVLLVITAFINTRIPLGLAYIISSTLGLVFTVSETLIQPFQDKWANYADVVLLTSLYLYLRRIQALSGAQPRNVSTVSVVSDIYLITLLVIISMIYFLLFSLHIHRQFPSLGSKIRQLAMRKKQKPGPESFAKPTLNGSNEEHNVTTSFSLLDVDSYQPPSVPHLSSEPAFRDSILEVLDEDD